MYNIEIQFKDYYYYYGYYYDDSENLNENPELFLQVKNRIFSQLDYLYRSSIEGVNLDCFEDEYDYITALQSAVKDRTKLEPKQEDEELVQYRKYFKVNNIHGKDLIDIIFWAPEYKAFIQYCRANGYRYMDDLFRFKFNETRKMVGINYILMDRIIDTFKMWCEKKINNRVEKKKETLQQTEEKLELINDVVDEFFF